MFLANADLRRITTDIWANTLGLSLAAAAGTVDPEDRVVTGRVDISGEWHGAVTVQCTDRLARLAAARMFDTAADGVSDEDVCDTLGELANITGGNVKSLLVAGCRLSLPAVSSGRGGDLGSGAQVIDRVVSSCDGEAVVVTVLGHGQGGREGGGSEA